MDECPFCGELKNTEYAVSVESLYDWIHWAKQLPIDLNGNFGKAIVQICEELLRYKTDANYLKE